MLIQFSGAHSSISINFINIKSNHQLINTFLYLASWFLLLIFADRRKKIGTDKQNIGEEQLNYYHKFFNWLSRVPICLMKNFNVRKTELSKKLPPLCEVQNFSRLNAKGFALAHLCVTRIVFLQGFFNPLNR